MISASAKHPQISRLAELIRGIESVMFTTINPDGSVNSRPMVVQDFDFDGDLWFFTQQSSGKVDAIVEDSHVCMAFMDPASNRYISASGSAEVVDDGEVVTKIWNQAFAKWFPQGPSDDDLVLIRVRVTNAEYWDTPHSHVTESFCFTAPALQFHKRGTKNSRFSREHFSHS